jgi:hypothetical protein
MFTTFNAGIKQNLYSVSPVLYVFYFFGMTTFMVRQDKVGFMAGCSCPVDGLGMGNLDGTKDDV